MYVMYVCMYRFCFEKVKNTSTHFMLKLALPELLYEISFWCMKSWKNTIKFCFSGLDLEEFQDSLDSGWKWRNCSFPTAVE